MLSRPNGFIFSDAAYLHRHGNISQAEHGGNGEGFGW